MIRFLLNALVSKIKGYPYQIDVRISSGSLLMLALHRCTSLIRGFLIFGCPSKKIFIESNVTLKNKKHIFMQTGVSIGKFVTIDGLSESGVHLGRNVNIGPYTIIQGTGIMTRLGKGLTIGDHSGVGAFSFFGCGGGVTIGSHVIMGQYVSFHAENHHYDRLDLPIKQQGVNRKGIRIGDNCWVGAKVTFLDGAVVGNGCVIAAGAVVKGEIPDNVVIAGVPAKIIKKRT